MTLVYRRSIEVVSNHPNEWESKDFDAMIDLRQVMPVLF